MFALGLLRTRNVREEASTATDTGPTLATAIFSCVSLPVATPTVMGAI